jgi:hypothetical protein
MESKITASQTTNLTHAEAFVALADCNDQCTLKLLVALVVGQAQLIEACVGGWQAIRKGWRRCYLKLWIEFLLRTKEKFLRTMVATAVQQLITAKLT